MKYTDEQRIEKMTITTEKLLNYLDTNHISQEDILSQETIRWTITTPLYNIANMPMHCRMNIRRTIQKFPGQKSQVSVIAWCMITTTQTGR